MIVEGVDYSVEFRPSLIMKDGTMCNGIVVHEPINTIFIREGLTYAKLYEVLWHEVMHIVFHRNDGISKVILPVGGFRKENGACSDLEEAVVDAMGRAALKYGDDIKKEVDFRPDSPPPSNF